MPSPSHHSRNSPSRSIKQDKRGSELLISGEIFGFSSPFIRREVFSLTSAKTSEGGTKKIIQKY